MIKFLILDVDGVMTDGKITYNEQGEEIKSFCVRDGMGIKIAQSTGINIIIMSGRYSKVTAYRAQELGIEGVYQGVKDKLELYESLKDKLGANNDEVAFIGDDINDLALIKRVGLSATVADAPEYVKEMADIVIPLTGGDGAVRNFIEVILKKNEKWENILKSL